MYTLKVFRISEKLHCQGDVKYSAVESTQGTASKKYAAEATD